MGTLPQGDGAGHSPCLCDLMSDWRVQLEASLLPLEVECTQQRVVPVDAAVGCHTPDVVTTLGEVEPRDF